MPASDFKPWNIDLVIDGSSGAEDLEQEWALLAKEIFGLWKQRQKKYGSSNIAAFGEMGCLVRGYDKIARLRNALFNHAGLQADDESVEDSWKDLMNYALMGLLCRRGKWAGAK